MCSTTGRTKCNNRRRLKVKCWNTKPHYAQSVSRVWTELKNATLMPPFTATSVHSRRVHQSATHNPGTRKCTFHTLARVLTVRPETQSDGAPQRGQSPSGECNTGHTAMHPREPWNVSEPGRRPPSTHTEVAVRPTVRGTYGANRLQVVHSRSAGTERPLQEP